MNTIDLGSFIRRKRKEKGFNQKEFAALLHVSPAAVNKWEKGKNYPDVQNLQAISALLEIPITDMLADCPRSPAQKHETDSVTSKPDSRPLPQPEASSAPAMPSPPEAIVPQRTETPESSDTAFPDREDTDFIEMPDTAVPQPEKASEYPPSIEKRIRLKTVIPLLTLLLVGIAAVCWIAGGVRSGKPSFTICDSYYGDYKGEDVYYVITEFESEPTSEDFFNFNKIVREEYEQHFSVVNQIVILYVQNYTDYIINGFNDNSDSLGILFPLSSD